jgi:hypothetical protein
MDDDDYDDYDDDDDGNEDDDNDTWGGPAAQRNPGNEKAGYRHKLM